jgi:fluoroquinolone transport system permease protein
VARTVIRGGRRWLALLGLQARLQWRYAVVGVAAALTVAWTGLLWWLPGSARPDAAAWLLLLDTAVLGTTVAGALVLLERGQGVLAALSTSPARLGELLAARVGTLAGLVLAAAVPVALIGRLALPAALAAVGSTALLTMLLAIAVAARCRSVIAFMVALPLVLVPLLLPAVAYGIGLRHPLLYAAPTTGAMQLLQGGFPAGWGAIAVTGWLAVAGAGAAVAAQDQLRRYAAAAPPPRPTRRAARSSAHTDASGSAMTARERWEQPRARCVSGCRAKRSERGPHLPASHGPVRAFVRSDLATAVRDPLLVLLALSPILLGLVIRFGYPSARDWLAQVHGFDLDPYRPVLLAVALLLHVPVSFGMLGALLVLDDVDDRALLAVRTSPLTLPRYLGYRATLVGVAALAGLVVAAPLSGLAPLHSWQLWPALLLAAMLAPVTALAALAVARNKVEGVAVLKLLALPLYAPLAGWWLTGPAGWPLALLPSWWVVQALWTGWPYAVAGAVLTAALLWLLARLALARLATAT